MKHSKVGISSMRYLLPFLAFILCAPGATADPRPLVELRGEALATVPDEREAMLGQFGPRVASNGETNLAVWIDHRRGSPLADIFGIAFTNDGKVLNRFGFPIAFKGANEQQPDVVWGDDEFLVVYRSLGDEETTISAARVSATGEVLERDIRVAEESFVYARLRLVFNAGGYFVLDPGGGGTSRMYKLDEDGHHLDDAVIPRADLLTVEAGVVTLFGTHCNPCGNDSRTEVHRFQLGNDLSQSAPTVIATGGRAWFLEAVASSPATTLVSWYSADEQRTELRITRDGVVVAEPADVAGHVRAAVWDGSSFSIFWFQATPAGDQVMRMRVSEEGHRLDPAPVVAAPPAGSGRTIAAAASAGAVVLARGYVEGNGFPEDFYTGGVIDGVILDPTGAGRYLELSRSLSVQDHPVIAASASGWLAAWLEAADSKNSTYVIRTAAVNSSGLPSEPVTLSEPSTVIEDVAIASDGTHFLIVWRGEGLQGQLVGGNGNPVADRFELPLLDSAAAVVWNGDEYVLMAAGHMVRVRRDGVPAGEPIWHGASGSDPALFWTGESYLLVTSLLQPECRVLCFPQPQYVFVRRLNASGLIVGELVVARDEEIWGAATAAWNGAALLVTWSDRVGEAVVVAARVVTPDLQPSSRFEIGATSPEASPAPFWSAGAFRVAVESHHATEGDGAVEAIQRLDIYTVDGDHGVAPPQPVASKPASWCFDAFVSCELNAAVAASGTRAMLVYGSTGDMLSSGGVKRLHSALWGVGSRRARSVRLR